jgi:hypothetical protein
LDHNSDGIVDQMTLSSITPSVDRTLIIGGGNVFSSGNSHSISIENVKTDDPVYKEYFKLFLMQKEKPTMPKEGPIRYKAPRIPLS